jgi:hypothetical protein
MAGCARSAPSLLSVANLSHQFTDLLSLMYFLLGAGQLRFGVQRPFPPGSFNPVVSLFAGPVVTALAVGDGLLDEGPRIRVVVEERGRHVRPVSDGPDGETASFTTQLVDGLLDLPEFVLGLPAAGGEGRLSLVQRSNA